MLKPIAEIRTIHVPIPCLNMSSHAYRNSCKGFGEFVSPNPRQLAADFACAVTVPSTRDSDWVARNGGESIFETLRHVLPQVGYACIKLPLLSHARNSLQSRIFYISLLTFRILFLVHRQIIQPLGGRHRRKGRISCSEFNKMLQSSHGFVCARTRRKSLAR